MANQLCRGYHDARDAGLIEDDAVVYLVLVMDGFTIDAEAQHPDDTDVSTYRYDGSGYADHTCADVTWQWSAADDEMRLDFTDAPEAFGTTVAAATDPPIGVLYVLQVGGSPSVSADWVIGFEDAGSYGNGTGLAYGVTVPAGGCFFSGGA